MAELYEIRANYDRETIVMYQAYSSQIADPALKQQRFVAPFSFNRMTWIKPSFLWLMHRSNWGKKSGQNRILAVHIIRTGWEKALSLGVLTSPEKSVYASGAEWEYEFKAAHVHIQWDTERSQRGAALPYFSVQVGLSRHIIREFVDDWIVKIEDLTPLVFKLNQMRKTGGQSLKRHLPAEKQYSVSSELGRRLMIHS
ncbi:DUF4291 domain-containing protein [Gimesia aquarii]|uniref:DUF4291 domain-containing protein n=1 Tax=Gimesia aquarii TaxID=2527964 RepID=A0A517VYZ7_9PLAN|nr:DUF4291 domain-containing protein [Gimesia aquarii]QDT98223.1 hypothetical protein V144x_37090 [Gimesia aquarii]